MKGIQRHILDFEIIPTGNPKTLVLIDSSHYYTNPEKPLLEITLPGYNKYFLTNVVARTVNTFNSNTIGITEFFNGGEIIDLPDGIYSFRYKICPYNLLFIDKKYFRTTLIEDRLATIYNQLIDECSDKKPEKFTEISEVIALIEGAKVIVNCDIKKANHYYRLASTLLDGINNKCKPNTTWRARAAVEARNHIVENPSQGLVHFP